MLDIINFVCRVEPIYYEVQYMRIHINNWMQGFFVYFPYDSGIISYSKYYNSTHQIECRYSAVIMGQSVRVLSYDVSSMTTTYIDEISIRLMRDHGYLNCSEYSKTHDGVSVVTHQFHPSDYMEYTNISNSQISYCVYLMHNDQIQMKKVEIEYLNNSIHCHWHNGLLLERCIKSQNQSTTHRWYPDPYQIREINRTFNKMKN